MYWPTPESVLVPSKKTQAEARRKAKRLAFKAEVDELRKAQLERVKAPFKSVMSQNVLEFISDRGFRDWYEEVTTKKSSDFLNSCISTPEKYLFGVSRDEWVVNKIKNLLINYRWQTPHYCRYWRKHISECADPRLRRAIMLRLATPKWANLMEIAKIHRRRARINRETGIAHHVDHIIPLQGRLVCGLNNEFNLRIITQRENILKSNKFEIV